MIFNQFIAGEGGSGAGLVVLPVSTEIAKFTLWTRPNLTSATSYGTVSGSRSNSNEEPWRALDGNASKSYYTYRGSTNQYLRWILPINLTYIAGVSSITVNCNRGANASEFWRIYGDTERTKPLTDYFNFVIGNKVAPVTTSMVTNVFELHLATATSDYVGINEIYFTNVYTTESTGSISNVSIKLLNQYEATVEEAIQGQTAGYKNDICLYEDSSGTKHLVAVKTGTLPVGAAKNTLVSETPLYLNEDKTEVITEKSGLEVYVEDAYEYVMFEEVGSPTIIDHKYTPSDYNYIMPWEGFWPDMGETWEIHLKITTPSVFSTHDNNRSRLINSTVDMQGIMLMTYTDKLKLCLSSNEGESWDIADTTSSLSLNNDTEYYIRVLFDGEKYDVDVSTDDVSWTNYISVPSTTIASPCEFFVGVSETEEGCWEGIIHLDDLSLSCDGMVYWRPYEESEGYVEIGSGHKYVDESAGYFNLDSYLMTNASQLVVHPEDFQESYGEGKVGYLSLIKPTATTTSAILTGIQNPTAAYAGSVCTPGSLNKKIFLDSALTNIIGSEDI